MTEAQIQRQIQTRTQMQKMNRLHESHRVHLYGKTYRMRTHRATTTRVPRAYDGKVLQVLMTPSIKLERHNNNLFDLYILNYYSEITTPTDLSWYFRASYTKFSLSASSREPSFEEDTDQFHEQRPSRLVDTPYRVSEIPTCQTPVLW